MTACVWLRQGSTAASTSPALLYATPSLTIGPLRVLISPQSGRLTRAAVIDHDDQNASWLCRDVDAGGGGGAPSGARDG